MHLSSGELRIFLDSEMSPEERAKVASHLATCDRCRMSLETIRNGLEITRRGLATFDLAGSEVLDASAARARFELRIMQDKETVSMLKNIMNPRYRPALGAVLAVLLIGLAFLFPGVRVAAGSFLGLFRVEQIAVVEINPANLPNQFGRSATLEEVVSENVRFEEFGEPQQVASVAEAEAETGLALRFPETAGEDRELMVQYGAEVSFDIEAAQIEFLLSEINRTDISFPDSLDGSTVTLSVPPSVAAGYGDCQDYEAVVVEKGEPARVNRVSDCIVYLQMPSPTIDAPADLNLPELGSAFLQLMGMSEKEADQFSNTIDWTTTLVVPLPQNQVDYEYMTIDGVQGTLITETPGHSNPGYMLLWVKDGVIYSISGQGSWKSGMALAESLP